MKKTHYDIDFTSILLAFLYAQNPISKWFRSYVRQADIPIKKVHRHKGLDVVKLNRDIKI